MRDLTIPANPGEQIEVLCGLLGPLGTHAHWRSLVSYLVNQRGLLIYTGDQAGEDWNLSNWFGLLNDRAGFYAERECGELVRSLYIAHELAHLIMPTPQRAKRSAFAAAFDLSERLASYETELRVYDDVPELVDLVPFSPLLASWLTGRGVDLTDAEALMSWRDAVVSQPGLLANELPGEADRMAGYGDNVGWASSYWDRLARIDWWDLAVDEQRAQVPLSGYREFIANAGAVAVETSHWRKLVGINVRRAYLLCGRDDPGVRDFWELGDLAAALDSQPMATEATVALYEAKVGK